MQVQPNLHSQYPALQSDAGLYRCLPWPLKDRSISGQKSCINRELHHVVGFTKAFEHHCAESKYLGKGAGFCLSVLESYHVHRLAVCLLHHICVGIGDVIVFDGS